MYYLDRTNRKYGKNLTLDEKQISYLMDYPWPGNVREVRNIIERYVVTGSRFVISSLGFENVQDANQSSGNIDRAMLLSDGIIPLKKKLRSLEMEYIHEVIDSCGGRINEAADLLGVHKSLLYRKLREEKEGAEED